MKKIFLPFLMVSLIAATTIVLTSFYSGTASVTDHSPAFASSHQVTPPTDRSASREAVSDEEADMGKRIEILKKKARAGNLEAQRFLFKIYRKGLKSVPMDLTEARKWVRISAEQGDLNSQADLGTMFAIGAGGVRDLKAARQWFFMAAKGGSPIAQSNLGVIYQFGRGVPVDLEKAAKWFRLAVKQGNSVAKEQLDKVQALLFQSMSSERQSCFKNPKCRNSGPIYLIGADGEWFVRVDKNLNRLSLLILKGAEKPHFERVIKDRIVPKIFLGADQEVSYEEFKNYDRITGAGVLLSESPRHYRMQIISSELVQKFVKSLENGERPILSLSSDNYWAGAEFFHLSKTIIAYERRTVGRSLNRHPSFLYEIMSPEDFSNFPGLKAITDGGRERASYDERPIKLQASNDPANVVSRASGVWSVENTGDNVYISVNGELTHGDHLRVAFDKNCDAVHTFASFLAKKMSPKMLEIEDRSASGIFNGEKINVKILFVLKVKHMRAVMVSLGWNAIEDIKGYFESKDHVSLKMLDDDQFKSTDYLDLVENRWSLAGFREALEQGETLCRSKAI